jgi:hypothetical protein
MEKSIEDSGWIVSRVMDMSELMVKHGVTF